MIASANATAVAIAIVRPTFGQHLQLPSIALIVLWLFCQKLAAMQTDDLERLLGAAVLDALRFAGLSVKEACALMSTTERRVDYFHFMAALKGEHGRHVPLAPLLRLGLKFWVALIPVLTYLATKQHVTDIAEELKHVRRLS